jgi:hypothetical protein
VNPAITHSLPGACPGEQSIAFLDMTPTEIHAELDRLINQGNTRDQAIQSLIRCMMVSRGMSAVATAESLLAARVKERFTGNA